MPTADEILRQRQEEEAAPVSPARRILDAVRSLAGQAQQAVAGQPMVAQPPAPPQAPAAPAGLAGVAPRIVQGVERAAGQVQQAAQPRFIVQPAPRMMPAVPAPRAGEGVVSPQGVGLRSLYLQQQQGAAAQPPAERQRRFQLGYYGSPWEQRAAEARKQRLAQEAQFMWQPTIPESFPEAAGRVPVAGRVLGPIAEEARQWSSPVGIATLPIGGVSGGAAKAIAGSFAAGTAARAVNAPGPVVTGAELAGAAIPGLTEAASRFLIAPQRAAARGLNARPLTGAAVEAPEAAPRFVVRPAEQGDAKAAVQLSRSAQSEVARLTKEIAANDRDVLRAFREAQGVRPSRATSAGVSVREPKVTSARVAPPLRQAEPVQVSEYAMPPSATTRAMMPQGSSEGGSLTRTGMAPTSRPILHQINDVDKILAEAQRQAPALDDGLRQIAGEGFFGVRVKAPERIAPKIAEGRAPNQVSDYLGGRVVTDDASDMVRRIGARFEVILDQPVLKHGYEARHLSVRLGPISAEVQVQSPRVAATQEWMRSQYERLPQVQAGEAEYDRLVAALEYAYGNSPPSTVQRAMASARAAIASGRGAHAIPEELRPVVTDANRIAAGEIAPEAAARSTLFAMPAAEAARPPAFGVAARQPEGFNPPPLELRSPEGKGGLFEVPEAQDWQAAIDARDAAQLPAISGGAMPATYQWRGVAPSVVRPTKGLWGAVTNTVRAARGLPRLTGDDFLRQAEARATVANYGRGIEEASRVSQQAVNDYRKMVPQPPRLKPTGADRAPEGLVGTELDILERPGAYKGGGELQNAREWWQEYGRMDLADLEKRGISVGAYEDYVFQHRYGDYFRRLGITDTSSVSASLRSRMPMQKARQFTTAYEAWKASEGGVAVAADKDGVLCAKCLAKGSGVKVGDTIQVGTRKAFGKEYPVMGRVERIGKPLLPDVTDAQALVASRFEQSALLRAQKELFDTVRDSGVNIARKGVPEGYKTLNNLPGPLADLKLLVPDGAGNTRLVSVRKLAWPTKTADALQGLLAPERLPAAAQGITNAVSALRDIRLNLDPSMITLIFSRYPLGHPITFLRNAREFGAVMRSEGAWRQWVAEDPMVRRFVDGGGGGLFQRMEYMPGEAKPLVERFARIPGTPISLQAANEETMRVIGYGTVKTAQVNEQVLRAVKAGMKIAGADKLNIPMTRIARMTDQEILEASVKSAMDQFGKLRYNDLGMSQWGKAVWRNSILTPGFLKTHISLLANSPKAFLGNPEGILGLVFLAQYAGITLGIAEGLSRISGFHTSADPRNLNFGAVRTPFGTFSTMGQVRTYMRLFANLPGDLHAGYYDRLYRSGLSRLGIVPNELAMQIKGEEYFGEPMGGPGQRLLSAGVRSLPIGFQTPIEIAMGKEGAVDPVLSSFADWSGASFWPRRTLDLLDEEMRKKYDLSWWDAEPWQRSEIEAQHPELQGRLGEEQKMAARRGVESAVYREALDRVTAPYDEQLKTAAGTLQGTDLRARYNDIQAQRQAAIRTLDTDARFARYLGKREERTAETLAEAERLRTQGKPLEAKHLLALYGSIFDRHEADPDTTAMFAELDAFTAGLSPADEKRLYDNLGLSLPPEIQSMRNELRTLKPYWAEADRIWEATRRRYAEAAPYESVDAYRASVQQRMVHRGLYGTTTPDTYDPILGVYNDGLSQAHQILLIRNPRMNATLAKWYGRLAVTPQAQQMAQEGAEQMYGLQAVGVGP